MFNPHTVEKNNTESRVCECTNCISANLSIFHQNVTFCHQFPFCLQCTSEAIKNWLILCCVLFSSVFSLCFKLWQFKFHGKREKGFEFGIWGKWLLQEVDKNPTAARMWVRVWAGCGVKPKLGFWSHCQGPCCRMLWILEKHRWSLGCLLSLPGRWSFRVPLVILGSLIEHLKIIKKLPPNYFGGVDSRYLFIYLL